jgi:hypothetical protein
MTGSDGRVPTLGRAMAAAFLVGSVGFVLGPFPGYIDLVGPQADAITFFVASLFFTTGGTLQTLLAAPERDEPGAGRAAWWTASIQLVGTLSFNVTTFRALLVTLDDPLYDRLVWRPDAVGSLCFLVSGAIAYRASARHGLLPARQGRGWWQPGVNLLGCVLFGIAAVAGYVVPGTGSMLDLAAANWTTAAGALCFLACAAAGLRAPQAASTVTDADHANGARRRSP